ncbi:MAG: methytransferase partner Trm112 [Thermoplasmata archaeon]|nr:methytransferase partner Trm112 [Thermoplasmata archaeon]
MRRELLDIVCCPICKGDLELKSKREENGEIIEGELLCKNCGKVYKIEDGIPNLLPE